MAKIKLSCIQFGVLMGLLCVGATAEGQSYRVTDLNTLTTPVGFEASGLNNAGEIIGYAPNSESYSAWIDNAGHFTIVNNTTGEPECIASAINDLGQLVGRVDYGSNLSATPFFYSGGTMTLLPTPSGTVGTALGINDSGQIAGYTLNETTGAYRAFLDTDGTMYDLNSLATNSNLTLNYAYGINASGEIVGYGTNTSGFSQAFVYNNGVVTDIGTLGGDNSFGFAINNEGEVIGEAQTTGDTEYDYFLYSDGQMIDLGEAGPRGGEPFVGINNEGQFVVPTNGYTLYDNGSSINLGSVLAPGYTNPLESFGGINDSGQILMYGFGPDGNSSYLLTPVPEPATLSVLAICAAGLLRRHRS